MAFRLAHLSDIHLRIDNHVPLTALFSKRAVGYLSWRQRRQFIHRAEVLDTIVADLRDQKVDHIVVTGDLVNIALPEEFAAAAVWLRTLGTPEMITVVPGNHDAYIPRAWRRGWAHWQPFMSDDASRVGDPVRFPFYRERGPLTIIGVSSAVPTAPLLASGRIGRHQLDRLRTQLQHALERDCFRVVLVHHPPAKGASQRYKRLRDGGHLRRLLEMMGAELVLSGHEHRFRFESLSGPAGPIPSICVPSASLQSEEADAIGGYAIYTIDRASEGNGRGAWKISVERRGFEPTTGMIGSQFRAEVTNGSDRDSLILTPQLARCATP